jgi:putative OPT family oligopeptide transporter
MPPSRPETVPEFTLKAVVAGVVLGIVFGAANAYLGLRLGLTVSASIPVAVTTVALFHLARVRGTILEANLAQTIGSASTSLASGTIFTIPALFLWGIVPPYLQVVALCFLGGMLGLAAMIPLRRLLIVREHATLPYPEGTACAEVLRATVAGTPDSVWIFRGMALGAAVKVALALVLFGHQLAPATLVLDLAFLPKAQVALEIAPAMVAVGFILGYRQSGILVAGSVLSALALTPLIGWLGANLDAPLAPETEVLVRDMSAAQIWRRYVRFIGAGAVAFAGILTVVKNMPSMVAAVLAVFRGLRGGAQVATEERTDRDLPAWFVVGGVVVVVLVAGLVPGVLAGDMGLGQRLVCAAGIALFGLLFVTVAARIVGIVGVSSQPTSGITLVTLIGVASVFVAAGWKDAGARAAVLTVGTIVAVAASKAGDISQDLKTGFLVGATPARQQLGQLIGAAFACWAVAATVFLLGQSYTFGELDFPAPQATLMKTVIEGLLAGELPWDLVLSGAGIAGAAMLCGISGLAFAIGVYLPLASMASIFLGGCMRALSSRERGAGAAEQKGSDPGILAASGIVAGEGLAGVMIAGLVGAGWIEKEGRLWLAPPYGSTASALLVASVCFFLFRAARRPAP